MRTGWRRFVKGEWINRQYEMASDNEIQYAIMNGINFGKAKSEKKEDPNKVKTKARKKAYQTGSHKSGAAKHKAEIRQRVKNRASQKKG